MTNFNEQDNITNDLVKYITGSANPAEREKSRAWIASSDLNRKYFDELKDVYEASVVSGQGIDFNAETSWEKVKGRFYKRKAERLINLQSQTKRHELKIQWLKIAAIFVIAFLLGSLSVNFWGSLFTPKANIVYNEVVAPYGSRSSVKLADGTRVWLNAGSKLRYPVNFANASRDVYLEGEAYFDVTKMQGKKFIVHTSHININVLGTEFNVKAYPGEKYIQTTLVKGRVVIEGTDKSKLLFKTVELSPNQMATYQTDLGDIVSVTSKTEGAKPNSKDLAGSKHSMVVASEVNPLVYTSWKDLKWIIVSEELQSLATKLERRYDVKISFENESLKKYKFTGTLTDETLEQVLKIIKITSPVEYRVENKNVIFKMSNSKKSYDELLINR